MLFTAKTITGYKLGSSDGEFGKVKEFYFDDKYWAVRYLVAETGGWLSGRQVLLSPYALASVSPDERSISIHLTRKQIEDSPSLDVDKPVSRQFEADYYGYYGWPVYWGGSFMWGGYPYMLPGIGTNERDNDREAKWDSHLRSTSAVEGYHIQAGDGEVGHVADFLIDDKTWAIRYLIIDTRNWWPGKRVLLSPEWIDEVSWDDAKVFVSLSLEAIKQAPEYTDETQLTRENETALHKHYDRPGYWVGETVAKAHLL